MIYKISHFVQEKLPWAWNMVEWGNEAVFVLQHHKTLKELPVVLERYTDRFRVSIAGVKDVPALAEFFEQQPEDAFNFFKPHEFNEKTLFQLAKRKSFLMFIFKDGEVVVGYFFLRCFFIGKAFLGKMVDFRFQRKGIGKQMCCCAMDVATMLGMRLFETISKDNLASLYSTQNVLDVIVIEEMDNGYLYIEDLRKKSNRGGLYLNSSLSRRRDYSYAA